MVIIIIILFGITILAVSIILIKNILSPKKLSAIQVALSQGKIATATRMAKQLVAKDNRNAEAHFLLGKAYKADNKLELALMEYKTVNQLGVFGGLCPEKEFRREMAELFLAYNQKEEALKEYLLLIKLEPSVGDYYFKAGELFEQRQKADRALNYYRKAIDVSPKHSDAHFKLGLLLYRGKKLLEAKAEMEAAVKLQGANYKAYFYLGKILKDNHEFVPSLLAFEKAQRDPEYKVRALVERGSTYLLMNNYDKAITELERAVKLGKDDSATEMLYGRYFLSICYEKSRNFDKAIEQWEKIYSKKPGFKDVAEKLGQYQELRADDKMKDYLTSNMDEFSEICKNLALGLSLTIRDVSPVTNGCQVIAVETSTKWRNARKIPQMLRFLRVPEMISETSIRQIHEDMKELSVGRAIIFSSSNFSRKAMEFSESRPIDLVGKDKLLALLKKTDAISE